MNGQVVWLKWEGSHFLRCINKVKKPKKKEKKCESGAKCPNSVEARKDESSGGCSGERFLIYNSQNRGPIKAGQTVWLKLKREEWLRCIDGRGCDAAATCPEKVSKRKITEDTGCYGERFVIEK
jgi:hypothetical protein